MTRQHLLRKRFHSLYLWHRWLGLLAAVFVLLLASTGILLNHAHDLGLDQQSVHSAWLLDAYGIQAPAPRSYAAGAHWVSAIGQRVYFDDRGIARDTALHGVLFNGQVISVVLDHAVALFTSNGAHIEDMPTPAPVLAAARSDAGTLLVRTATGWWQADAQFLAWSAVGTDTTRHSIQPAPAPAALQTALLQHYRGTTLSWERVLLDLHSGRLFGMLGRYVMDVAALLLMVLALSGIVVWWQRRAQRRVHQRR